MGKKIEIYDYKSSQESIGVKEACVRRLTAILNEKNIAINALANEAGVTPSTVYSMMKESRRDVSIVTIKKLCDGLGITLGEFFSDEVFEKLEQEIR